ncbi:PAS domain-containing protein [Paenibacillus hamazuiensis]|uniref:PAS domain-containing protein n=1 Tax=Paenibacillus hamazuiensis TaxID=2936508 RepID=UPI00200FC33D|nr:PAS domain S-box protein [Paenibacillus hamazuiensis]
MKSSDPFAPLSRTYPHKSMTVQQQIMTNLFQFGHIGVALLSLSGHFLRANPAYCDMVGYSEYELLGKDILSITHPGDLLPSLSLSSQLIEGSIPSYIIEKRYVHRDGRTVWVRKTGTLLRERLKPAHMLIQVEDISAEKRLEQWMMTANKKLKNVYESISDAYVTVDREAKFVYVNKAAEKLFGRRRDDLLGQCLWGLFPEAADSPFLQQMQAALEEMNPLQVQAYSPDCRLWLDVRISPSKEETGIFFRDITSHIDLEKMYREAKEQLDSHARIETN